MTCIVSATYSTRRFTSVPLHAWASFDSPGFAQCIVQASVSVRRDRVSDRNLGMKLSQKKNLIWKFHTIIFIFLFTRKHSRGVCACRYRMYA